MGGQYNQTAIQIRNFRRKDQRVGDFSTADISHSCYSLSACDSNTARRIRARKADRKRVLGRDPRKGDQVQLVRFDRYRDVNRNAPRYYGDLDNVVRRSRLRDRGIWDD